VPLRQCGFAVRAVRTGHRYCFCQLSWRFLEIPTGRNPIRNGRYDRLMSSRETRIAGLLRCTVGLTFLITPRTLLSLTSLDDSTGGAVFMMRTKGIRDLAIGVGTVAASTSDSDEDRRRWILAALGNDTFDALVAFLSQASIGRVEAMLYAGTATALAGLDRWALRSLRSPAGGEAERLSSSSETV
jgi:hypothetical protein